MTLWHCLCDPRFSHLCRNPTCDRQTHGDSIYRIAERRAVKMLLRFVHDARLTEFN